MTTHPNWTEVARYGAEQAENAEKGGHFWIYADGSISQTSYGSPDLDHAGLLVWTDRHEGVHHSEADWLAYELEDELAAEYGYLSET